MDILVWNSLIQGFSVGLIWVPLSVVAFDTLAPSDRAEASSVFHLLRNIGSSFFISLSHRRDRAGDGGELQPHDGDDLALQHDAFPAVGDGRLGLRHALPALPKSPRRSRARRR